MKYPSQHRFPVVSDSPDDWGGGSWTVDCICGVTFDDGAEMVNCNECSVWVHTRCSCFVQGEERFACHECRSKNAPGDNSKETEGAQLLVNLPTKTIQMDGRLASVQRPPPSLPCPLFKRGSMPMVSRAVILPFFMECRQYFPQSCGNALDMCPRSSISSTRSSLGGRMGRRTWRSKGSMQKEM